MSNNRSQGHLNGDFFAGLKRKRVGQTAESCEKEHKPVLLHCWGQVQGSQAGDTPPWPQQRVGLTGLGLTALQGQLPA